MLQVQNHVDQHTNHIEHDDYHFTGPTSFEVNLSEEEKMELQEVSSIDSVGCEDCDPNCRYPLELVECQRIEESPVCNAGLESLTVDAYQLGLLLGGFLSAMNYISYSCPCYYYDCCDRNYYDCYHKNACYYNCCDCA
uniref:Major 19 kDa immunoreactive glycoprotein n=1 Tax=Ehrlichia canis TaxID=944 RepID=A0A2U9EXM9_EHRCA|nr:major 19 kDa immunoreactive glycoprotein [Ehrlichia canis]